MSKKIVILNGSPRAKGNTAAMIREFVKGAEEAGNSITEFNLQQMNIRPCIGCLAGGKNPDSPCTQKDDMDPVYAAYREADVVVLASPLYYWSFSGQLKVAIDRLFAVTEANNWQSPQKACAMLIAAGDESAENFAPMISYYETMTRFLNWRDLGQVLIGGVLHLGDIENNPKLAEACKLGKSIA